MSTELNGFDYFIKALKNYTTFSGRARRKEYWYFALFQMLISTGLSFVDGFLLDGKPLFSGIFGLAMLIPAIAVLVRRFHDVNKSGWWALSCFILIGYVFLFLKGTEGPNKYGDDPKQI